MPTNARVSGIIRIVVPGEPMPYRERAFTFRRRRPGKRGQPIGSIGVGSHKPKAIDDYQNTIVDYAVQAMAGRDPIDGPVRLHIRAYVRIPKKTPKYRILQIRNGRSHPCRTPDLTNVAKLAEDALNGVVFKDDKQVVRWGARSGRFYSFRPRLEIDVEPVEFCQMQVDELVEPSPAERANPSAGRS